MATPATDRLKKTRWYKPALEDYGARLKACAGSGIEFEEFETVAVEILNTPEDMRDWLLTTEPIPESAPFVRFRQYDSPRAEDMPTGLFYRDYRKGRK